MYICIVYTHSAAFDCQGIKIAMDHPARTGGGDQRGRPLAEESIFYSQPLSGGMCACIHAFYYTVQVHACAQEAGCILCTVQYSPPSTIFTVCRILSM